MTDGEIVSCITDSISRGKRIALGTPPASPQQKKISVKKQVEKWLDLVAAGAARDGPFELPGTGPVGDRCGMLVGGAHECLNCEHRWPSMISCKRWTCPRCAPSRVCQVAMYANRKLAYVGVTLPEGLALRRSSINIPTERWGWVMDPEHHRDAVTRLRRRAVAIARQVGYVGSAVVFHPYRDSQERWRFDVLGPHFHVTGWARSLAPWGKGEYLASDGWTVSHRPERWPPGTLYRKLAYDLTHVGTAANRPSLTWWGQCHNRANPLPERAREELAALYDGHLAVCPSCDSINTRRTLATLEELIGWAGSVHRLPRRVRTATQHRFAVSSCDDCGDVALEPIPERRPGTEIIERPWTFNRK